MCQPLPEDGRVLYVCALMYGIIFDVLLQVFGTAAVWGSSDCFGVRGQREGGSWHMTEDTCRSLSYIWSIISAARYVWRIYKYKVDGGLKNCSGHYEALHTQGLGGTGRTKRAAIIYSFGVGFCSLGEGWRMFQVFVLTKGVGLAPQSHSSLSEIINFFAGFVLHFILRVILEVLGAAGAVWGIFEVMEIRNESNSSIFSQICLAVSLFVLVRLTLGFVANNFLQESQPGAAPGEAPSLAWWCFKRNNIQSQALGQAYQGIEMLPSGTGTVPGLETAPPPLPPHHNDYSPVATSTPILDTVEVEDGATAERGGEVVEDSY
jgi:hypothetical protein